MNVHFYFLNIFERYAMGQNEKDPDESIFIRIFCLLEFCYTGQFASRSSVLKSCDKSVFHCGLDVAAR